MDISDIGSTDDTALICNTNCPATLSTEGNARMHSGGDWFGPDGTAVGTRYNAGPGFRMYKAPGMVRLIRYTTNINPSLDGMTFTPPEGIYHCVVEDATLTQQTVYVGLYNSGGGSVCMCVCWKSCVTKLLLRNAKICAHPLNIYPYICMCVLCVCVCPRRRGVDLELWGCMKPHLKIRCARD